MGKFIPLFRRFPVPFLIKHSMVWDESLITAFRMVLHPPALYLGFIGVFIPAAYELSALITNPNI
jgi:hypothetical protein